MSEVKRWRARVRLPIVAAPMLQVSGPELVTAVCAAGAIGSFPTANARTVDELDSWLSTISRDLSPEAAPYAPNLIMRSPRLTEDLAVLAQHQCELVIASVGSPALAVEALRSTGTTVFADVATVQHARRALDAGAAGLVLLTAGSGGQTGWLNPFAFVRAVREFFDGPLMLAGGVTDGQALRAARVLGCDFAYMGTRFLATSESRASKAHKQMVVDSSADDIVLTSAFTGLPASMLRPSIENAGLDPAALDDSVTPTRAAELYGSGGSGPTRWSQIWSAGHSVSGVQSVLPARDAVELLLQQYESARTHYAAI